MDQDYERRLATWLGERGIDEPRRVVRESASGVLVSKFPEGFAANLHGVLDRLDSLFDDAAVLQHYRAIGAAEPSLSRVTAWHRAVLAIVFEAAASGIVTDRERAEVEAGIDSVAALLDSVLWSGPACAAAWRPGESERTAFADALARMDDGGGMFTRYYGDFEGAPVQNHCPGATVARRLLRQAWTICTGEGIEPGAIVEGPV